MRTKALFVATLLALAPLPSVAQDFNVGLAAYQRGDYSTTLKEWKPLAEQGYARAQSNLGVMYEQGHGVLQDYAEAVRWYRAAAEQGYARAQGNLGFMYAKGQGVAQDYAEAVRWYLMAADQGDAPRKTILASCMPMVRACCRTSQRLCDGIDWPPIRVIPRAK